MPNKLSIIIDHFLYIRNLDDKNYTRHLRPARDLLVLCDNDTDKAKEVLDKTEEWVSEWGGEEWGIETCIKYYANNLKKLSSRSKQRI